MPETGCATTTDTCEPAADQQQLLRVIATLLNELQVAESVLHRAGAFVEPNVRRTPHSGVGTVRDRAHPARVIGEPVQIPSAPPSSCSAVQMACSIFPALGWGAVAEAMSLNLDMAGVSRCGYGEDGIYFDYRATAGTVPFTRPAPGAGAVVSLGFDVDGTRIRRKISGKTRAS